jgi:putative transposase
LARSAKNTTPRWKRSKCCSILSNGTVRVDPQFGIHRLMKLVKGRSSRLLRQEFPVLKRKLPTLWTNSYFCATTGGVPLAVVKQYIEQQKHV